MSFGRVSQTESGVSKINIYDYRTQRGWTQSQLAHKVDVSQPAVVLWERGKPPLDKHKRRIAEVFGVKVEDIEWGEKRDQKA